MLRTGLNEGNAALRRILSVRTGGTVTEAWALVVFVAALEAVAGAGTGGLSGLVVLTAGNLCEVSGLAIVFETTRGTAGFGAGAVDLAVDPVADIPEALLAITAGAAGALPRPSERAPAGRAGAVVTEADDPFDAAGTAGFAAAFAAFVTGLNVFLSVTRGFGRVRTTGAGGGTAGLRGIAAFLATGAGAV